MAVDNGHFLYRLIRNTDPRQPGVNEVFKESDDTGSLSVASDIVLSRTRQGTV